MTSGVATMTSHSSQPSLIFWMYSMPDEVGAGRLGFLGLLALGDHQHPDRLAGAVRQHHRAADDLVGVPRIDAQAHGDVDRLVELGERGLPSPATPPRSTEYIRPRSTLATAAR